MTRRGQRGFTLIELMVALLVSSLLVGMILAIFSRMSLAYRGQQQIAGVQQVLAAARATIELDAKQAGLGMSQGFKSVPTGAVLQSPVKVIDGGATAPDQVAFFYADTSTQAVVVGGALPTLQVDSAAGFIAGTRVVLTTGSTMQSPGHGSSDPYVASYQACVVEIAVGGIAGTNVTFSAVAPWGPSTAAGCVITSGTTMMYPLIAHAYSIDTTATTRGALQMSVTGNLLGVAEQWTPLAYGFSDIQTAVRLEDSTGDVDADGDPIRNWYSGANQATATALPITPANALVIGMSITLVAHTDRDVEGIATVATPALTGAIVNNNNLGNRPSTVLPTARPWPDPLLPGLAVYRYTTFTVDFRNLGVGQ
jgi:prepilin-type N-terminal cleavage/methylation domain-containing protein